MIKQLLTQRKHLPSKFVKNAKIDGVAYRITSQWLYESTVYKTSTWKNMTINC